MANFKAFMFGAEGHELKTSDIYQHQSSGTHLTVYNFRVGFLSSKTVIAQSTVV